MISHNLEYWDDEVLQLYPALYEAFLDMLEHDMLCRQSQCSSESSFVCTTTTSTIRRISTRPIKGITPYPTWTATSLRAICRANSSS